MDNLTNFAEVLFELLKKYNITLQKLAEDLNISKGRLSLYLNGKNNPSLLNLLKICEYFDVSLDYITARSDKMTTLSRNKLNFIARLYQLMKEFQISKYKLAKHLQFNYANFYKWDNGAMPSLENLIKLADYFCVSIDYLVGISDKR